jgi:hypothetical protein
MDAHYMSDPKPLPPAQRGQSRSRSHPEDANHFKIIEPTREESKEMKEVLTRVAIIVLAASLLSGLMATFVFAAQEVGIEKTLDYTQLIAGISVIVLAFERMVMALFARSGGRVADLLGAAFGFLFAGVTLMIILYVADGNFASHALVLVPFAAALAVIGFEFQRMYPYLRRVGEEVEHQVEHIAEEEQNSQNEV